MPGIRISDLTECDLKGHGFLAFDLADLLEVLGDSARSSTWKCSVEECIATENARPYLEEAYNTPEALTGRDLFTLARETRQVIDGAFEAFHGGEDTPWLKLEAIDSTYWEVFARDSLDLSRFESHFRKVERIDF